MAVELVSKGAQDVFLTGTPEVSFFRQNYKRHTNFAFRNVRLDPLGSLAASSEISIKIPNKGDLLGYIWIDLGDLLVSGAGINADSATDCAQFDLYIGGQLVDRQDAFFAVKYWNKYLLDSSAKAGAASDAGNVLNSTWLPLHFFFCDNVYLPLVALQYHEVEVRIKFASGGGSPAGLKFYANYVMLDTDERAAFVNTDHELLIEQVQRIPFDSSKFNLGLLNHPVKCLLWGSDNAVTDDVQLYLNGTEIFNQPMPAKFFRQVQGYYHSDFNNTELANLSSYLFMYSFAVKANKHQPSGTCNFSRMDTATLSMTVDSGTVNYLHAVNYNVLRIKKGMAGLAFSN
jgi:hypothetical protein